jgi:hypothetical protein
MGVMTDSIPFSRAEIDTSMRSEGRQRSARFRQTWRAAIAFSPPAQHRQLAAKLEAQVKSLPGGLRCLSARCFAVSATSLRINARARDTAPFARVWKTSGSAWMACIIARTAGKHVTSLSRTPVDTETKRIELHLDADPRFAAAAGGAVRYLAEASGMSEDVCREFQAATVRACLQAFRARNTSMHVIEFLLFEDRVEVVIDSNSGPAAIRLARPVASHK